jgi:hypothetical protein
MPRKKIVREPVEKLSSDAIIEITEDSSSEEEDTAPMIKPKPVKKPRTAKQLANDQRLRDKKNKKVEPVIDEMDISTHPVKPVSVAIDENDKPLTKKEMLELMEQMNAKPEPVKKPRKPRATKKEMEQRKAEKVVIETPPTPPPPPTPLKRSPPEMLFV